MPVAALPIGIWVTGKRIFPLHSTMRKRIALIGDYNPEVIAHRAIPEAVKLAGAKVGVPAESIWVPSTELDEPQKQLRQFHGIWVVPASPYDNTAGVLEAIRYARENKLPFLGSCGGFQHMILEYARNVLGIATADHAETNPAGDTLVITLLSCSLIETSEDIVLQGGMVRRAYGSDRIQEEYRCNYGINPQFEEQLFNGNFKATAYGAAGEIRAAELDGHPFFVGTLFQSERRALKGEPPPLAVALVQAAR
jgi:CTP synthase (UTP-ammonia lyase)